MSEPTISQLAQGATALLTVASFTKLYFLDRKLGDIILLIEHEDIGLLGRVKRLEAGKRRHSDALKAMGAELEE